MPSNVGRAAAGVNKPYAWDWLDNSDWIISFDQHPNVYVIVARKLVVSGEKCRNRDRRSARSIALAFSAFLDEMEKRQVRTAHVQMLSGGDLRLFDTWISLAQMARTYGEHYNARKRNDNNLSTGFVTVRVYVNEPGAVAMLQGSYIDLSEHLQAAEIRLVVELIFDDTEIARHHRLVNGDETVGSLIPVVIGRRKPRIYTLPRLTDAFDRIAELDLTVRDFGLVSGCTLVVDFRSTKRQSSPMPAWFNA